MKIALIQMIVLAGDVETNRANGLAMVKEAAPNAAVIIMPEIWTTGYSLRQVEVTAEDITGPTITALRDPNVVNLAREKMQVWRDRKPEMYL